MGRNLAFLLVAVVVVVGLVLLLRRSRSETSLDDVHDPEAARNAGAHNVDPGHQSGSAGIGRLR
jgi:hypothetical protein